MDRLEQIRDLGRSLGYEEAELREFVTEREMIERQVRFEEREDKRLADEKQTKTLADEMEYRKEEMKLKFDLEISRNQLESERMRTAVTHNVGDSNQDVGYFQMHKLPYFVDGIDNIDSYLARFETYAHSMNWPLERYSLCLSSLLTGDALDVLAKIPQSLVHDYEHLKNTLLAEYQLASGDFMKIFFSSRQRGNESATQCWVG